MSLASPMGWSKSVSRVSTLLYYRRKCRWFGQREVKWRMRGCVKCNDTAHNQHRHVLTTSLPEAAYSQRIMVISSKPTQIKFTRRMYICIQAKLLELSYDQEEFKCHLLYVQGLFLKRHILLLFAIGSKYSLISSKPTQNQVYTTKSDKNCMYAFRPKC